jgi:hypothetical protein
MALDRSPGTYLSEQDFSEVAANLGTTIAAVVGAATKGSLNKPIYAVSVEDLIRKVGAPLLTDYAIQAAVQYLKTGRQIQFMRVANATDPTYGVLTANRPVPGTSGGTPAVAATGTIVFTGSSNPSDGETVTINDGTGAATAFGLITLLLNQDDASALDLCDETVANASGSLNHTVTPNTGDTVTFRDPLGVSKTYEYTAGGGASPGNVEVDKSATTTNGAEELRAAIVAQAQTIAVTRTGNVVNLVSSVVKGNIGNTATLAVTGTNPPTRSGPTLTGGNDHGVFFEFDTGSSVRTGAVRVAVGSTVASTLANLIAAINAQATLHLTAVDNTANNGGVPQIKLWNDVEGVIGNGADMTHVGTGYGAKITLTAFAGGADGPAKTFEFDSNGVWSSGNVPVLIGATAADSMSNLIAAINVQVGINAVDGTVTVPQANLTHRTAGAHGNIAITESGANITATGMAGGAEAIPGAITSVMGLYAYSPGTWGNSIRVDILATAVYGAPAGSFDLVVYYPVDGVNYVAVEKFTNVNLTANDPRNIVVVLADGVYGEASPSAYLTATVLSAGGSPSAGLYNIGTAPGAAGRDGIVNGSGTRIITASDIVGTVNGQLATGLQSLRNREQVKFNVLSVPGISHKTVIDAGIQLCAARMDAIYSIDPPFGLSRDEIISWHNGASPLPDSPTLPLNSSYATLSWPWLRASDTYNKRRVWLPPSGFHLAVMAYTDQTVGPWGVPAGFSRGVVDALEVECSAGLEDRHLLLAGQARINTWTETPGGITLIGNRTLLRSDSDLSYLNSRRMLIYAEDLVRESGKFLVFEPHDPITWNRFRMLVNPILANIQSQRGLYKYEVVCDERTNPTEQVRQRVMKGKIKVQSQPDVEVLETAFNLYAYGADFTEPTV